MNIKQEMQGDVAVLSLSGTMMGAGETTEFKDLIHRLSHEKRVTQIVVDLGRVKWMNSSAIGILTSGLQEARSAGGDVRLARAGERIISVLVTMHLQRIFRSYQTVEDAITSFNMQMDEEMQDDVAVLHLSGTMMGGAETAEFQSRVEQLIQDGSTKIVVDLGQVRWMNSTAIGILASSLNKVRETGGDLRPARVSKQVSSVFADMQLDKVF
jgi:anti-sigma B factor antagonist